MLQAESEVGGHREDQRGFPASVRHQGNGLGISPASMKTLIRFSATIAGLAGLGIIVHEVLRKWQLVDPGRGILWTIVPMWVLFVVKEATASTWLKEQARLPPRLVSALGGVVSAVLIILAVMALISIPFIWFGVIEELASGGGFSR